MKQVFNFLNSHPDWGAVMHIYHTLQQHGYKAFLAGGCVRDALMGNIAQDLDLATDANPEVIEKLFDKTISVGKAFGVMRILIDGADIEVATFRCDGNYLDGRRPEAVTFSSEKEDALRRDFTMNALFYDLSKNEVIDFVHGVDDLQKKLIRTVGNPRLRFQEDHLRLMRAVRFVSQLNFHIEEETLAAITEMSSFIETVSGERVRDELFKLLRGSQVEKSLKIMKKTGLWTCLFPKLKFLEHWPVHCVTEIRWQLFSLLLRGSDLSEIKKYVDYLKLSNQEKKNLMQACTLWGKPEVYFEQRMGWKIHKLVEEGTRWGLMVFGMEGGRFNASAVDMMQRWHQMHEKLPPAFLNGDDLKGLAQGREIGQILELAFELQLEGKFLDRQEALRWLDNYLNRKN